MLNKRRGFLIAGFLTTAVFIMNSGKIFTTVSPKDTLDILQNDLFAKAETLGVNVSAYLSLILQHSRINKDDKEYIRNGTKWINEEAVEVYKKLYHELTKSEREQLLKRVSKSEWGESYMATILTYILEAIFSDPVYGVNTKRAGQKWLKFENGLPYPKEALL